LLLDNNDDTKLKSLCVFCGSRSGNGPIYDAAAEALAQELGARNIRLIYGGGGVGLMGVTAKKLMALGGEVVGIIPDFLQELEGYDGISRVIVTKSMHERKQTMFDLCDAFLSLPGGIGTLDETMEMMTWSQLDRHTKPIGLLNLEGYWDPLIALLTNIIDKGFAEDNIRDELVVAADVAAVLDGIEKRMAAG
jgi:hypothetical protein